MHQPKRAVSLCRHGWCFDQYINIDFAVFCMILVEVIAFAFYPNMTGYLPLKTGYLPLKKKPYLLSFFLVIIVIQMVADNDLHANQGIKIYYVRYDVKSSENTIIDDNLVMIPAKNEYRAGQFQYVTVTGYVNAGSNTSLKSRDQRIKEHALKTILLQNGLKSINSKDMDTVVSYEGVVKTPIRINEKKYIEFDNRYHYTVAAEFSPISFPDQWERSYMKNRIKKAISGFFDLFK
jgi:hypothetical protein